MIGDKISDLECGRKCKDVCLVLTGHGKEQNNHKYMYAEDLLSATKKMIKN